MEDQRPPYDAALHTLARFSQDEWLGWIAGVLNANYREPVIVLPRGEEINTLFWVFNRFTAGKTPLFQDALVNYCEAIVKYLDLIPPLEDNYPYIFTLIHFINGTRPYMCRHEIEQLIRGALFENCVLNEVNLNYFLAKAYIPIEDSQKKPLQDWMDHKLVTAKHPYFYYVYFKYQHKYFSLFRGLTRLFGSGRQLQRKMAGEIVFALKEIALKSRSFGPIVEALRGFLNRETPIPNALGELISIFEMAVEYIQSGSDARSMEKTKECRELMSTIRRMIYDQARSLDLAAASPRRLPDQMDSLISSTIPAYGSDSTLLRLLDPEN